jgi:hypothetical protein
MGVGCGKGVVLGWTVGVKIGVDVGAGVQVGVGVGTGLTDRPQPNRRNPIRRRESVMLDFARLRNIPAKRETLQRDS